VRAVFSCILLVWLTASASAVEVIRGPYLQMGTATELTIRWRTDVPVPSVIEFGVVPGALDRSLSDQGARTSHELRLDQLTPGARFWYAIGDGESIIEGGDSGTWFQTPSAVGEPDPLKIWVLGDSGLPGEDQDAVRDAYFARHGNAPDLVLMLGDNAYEDGTDAQYQAGLFDPYAGVLRHSVLWPARGNHDESHAGDDDDYFDFFTLPTAGECGGAASGTESWFSFDVGNVHFICFDSYLGDLTDPSEMLDWMAADLAANSMEWTIAFTHYSPYTKGSHDSDLKWHSALLREQFLPVLEAGGVDLVLTGHSHGYERSYLLDGHYGDSTTFSAAHVLDDGDGYRYGNGEYHKPSHGPAPHEGAVYVVAGSASRTHAGTFDHPAMFRGARSLGSLALTVEGSTLEAEFITPTGYVSDRFAIVKGEIVAAPSVARAGRPRVYPNPFEDQTTIRFAMADAGRWSVEVYDLAGRRVRGMDGESASGAVIVPFDGRDAGGRELASGTYFYRVSMGRVVQTGRMSLVR
jgi:predicted phosphodiesterase